MACFNLKKNKKFIVFFLIITFSLTGLIKAKGLVPCGGPDEQECTACHLLVLVQNIIDFILEAVFIVCICLIVYGGFRWLFSFGNDKNIAAGQKAITSALIGLMIVLASWLIVNTILYFLKPQIEGIDLQSSWWQLKCY